MGRLTLLIHSLKGLQHFWQLFSYSYRETTGIKTNWPDSTTKIKLKQNWKENLCFSFVSVLFQLCGQYQMCRFSSFGCPLVVGLAVSALAISFTSWVFRCHILLFCVLVVLMQNMLLILSVCLLTRHRPLMHISRRPGRHGVPSTTMSCSITEKRRPLGLQCSWHGVAETRYTNAHETT